jgi:hypothetical protein
MTKRRFTIKEVLNITQMGAPTARSGKAASWAEPAYTNKLIAIDCSTVNVDFAMAIPVTKLHVKIVTAECDISLKP